MVWHGAQCSAAFDTPMSIKTAAKKVLFLKYENIILQQNDY